MGEERETALQRNGNLLKLSLGPLTIELKGWKTEGFGESLRSILEAVRDNLSLMKEVAEEFTRSRLPSAQVPPPAFTPKAPAALSLGELSLVEVLKRSGVKAHTEKALLIVYYLYNVRGLQTVNARDLQEAYAEARLAAPANFNDTLNKLVTTGRLTSAGVDKDGMKAFRITQTGDEEAERLLSPVLKLTEKVER
ncbi:hypothetical protein [Candidatus Hecatella orcuttiae]|jgi:hypothetical protein|uniref:hypothetical protein n=1 Tax=Candidatus Hecatella orcuttiae TaxID=1935119 RepID=UPI002867BC4D|nr:hypothetical protein [Candidatus Hecatella orcuttiae]